MRARGYAVAIVMLVVSALGWGVAGTFIKFALDSWGPMTLLVGQLVAANVVLWAALLIRGYRRPANPWKVALLGVLEPGLCYSLLTVGLLFTSAANAAILSAMESFFAIILAVIFLRERLGKRSISGLILAAIGVIILESEGSISGVHFGDALILVGILAAGFYVVVARGIAASNDTLTLTAHQFAVGLVLTLPFAVVRWMSGAEAPIEPRPMLSWVAVGIVGVFCYGGSSLLYNFAIGRVRAGVASMILNLMPVFGLLAAIMVLGERLGWLEILGAVLVIASIFTFSSGEIAGEKTTDTMAQR